MKTVFRLLSYTKKHKDYMALAIIGTVLYAVLNLIGPLLLRDITDIVAQGLAGEKTAYLMMVAAKLLAIYALRSVMLFFRNNFGHRLAWHITGEMRISVFAHMEKLSMGFYHDKQTGHLMSRIVNDTAHFENLLAHAIPDFITNLIMLLGVSGILVYINPTLTLFSLIPIPFMVAASWVFSKKIRPEFRKAQAVIGDLSAQLQDSLSGMREIQSFNQEKAEEAEVAKVSRRYVQKIIAALTKSAVFHPIIEFFSSFGTVVVVAFCGLMGASMNVPVADIVAFLLYLGLFYAPISTFARLIEDIQQSTAGAERVFELLDTQPDIINLPGAKNMGRMQGGISFEGVTFSYLENQPVLADINFSLQPGQMLALVGPTGVGKTTIASLLSRFYEPQKGQIYIDGEDIRGLTLHSLREQISMVMQDVFLFNGTVAENIAYGNKTATQEEIEEAAKIACAHGFILDMPEGYNTYIGERGVKLSGGQKQRLSIARAVLRNAPILVLDEATASVDTETEREIQKAVQSLMGRHTMIVIAHRLSTVKQADKILVLEDGRIAEEGTHAQLIAKNGLYARMCGQQLMEN